MRQYSLNELFSQYTTGKLNRTELEGAIYSYYLYNQNKTSLNHWNRDIYEDYISWFYQRLRKAIDSYRETGSSFEAFMRKFMLISSKEYRVRITTGSVTEYSVWNARVPELFAHEESSDYPHEKDKNILSNLIVKQNGRKNTRYILALVLKCYYYVSDDFLGKISLKTGIDGNELREMIDKIRKMRQKKDDEIYHMKERIYGQYYRCIIYEKRLSLLQENTAAYNKLKLQLEKARQRLEKMRKRVKLIRTDATNSQVAEVIGVKKGTVDASLYKLKVKCAILSDKSLLN
ncbi:MAG: hypothetical protein LBQ89_01795 [Treponema sp.]|nr:hypothetical protein [Treponema sp.]